MLPFHSLANLFPLIEGEGFDALVADVKANGLLDEIVMHEGQILDGRNRYRAAVAAGLMAEDVDWKASWAFVEFSTDGIDGVFSGETIAKGPLAFVLSKNLARRHLNESQRAMIAARVANLSAHRPVKSADLQTSQPEAATKLNVSTRLVASAKSVQDKGSPELVAAVDAGKLAVSAAAQAAKLPEEQQRRIAEKAQAGDANVVRTVIKQGLRAEREQNLAARQLALPEKQYGVILADPEWKFDAWGPDTGNDRSPLNHYPVSSVEAIMARDVGKIAAANCVLGLWVTDLPRGLAVLSAWGFEYRSYFVWVKDIVEAAPFENWRRMLVEIGPPGTGFWNRDRDEIFLVGTRGEVPCPAPGTQGESVWFAARPKIEGTKRGRHSAKPDNAHEWFEKHFPNWSKIELNARGARAGWDVWGNEAPDAPIVVNDEIPAGSHADHSAAVECIGEGPEAVETETLAAKPIAVASAVGPSFDELELPPFLDRRKTHSEEKLGGRVEPGHGVAA